jgi:hypothetical protein
MVEMAMRDEDVADPPELARRQRRDIADVEQDGAPAEAEVDEHARVTEGVVDQACLGQPAHGPASYGLKRTALNWRSPAIPRAAI